MRLIFLDFETYYDKEYSLRKMTPVEYVLDPRFEVIGCAIKDGMDGKPYWLDGDALPAFFASLDPSETMLVTHNALFDMCIVAWVYNFVPRLMVDTLGVSRALLGHRLRSLSLASVAQHLGLGVKGTTVHNVIGMGSAAIKAAGLYESYVDYSCNDVTLCAGIYEKLVRSGLFPRRELAVMDMVLRCAIKPKFILDQSVLAQHLHEVKQKKDELLAKSMLLGVNGKSDLMSNEIFAQRLRDLGVDPPMKTSLTTGKLTYAFAKSDAAFLELEEHPDPNVQVLMAARMGHKSTLDETRTERLLSISNLTWKSNPAGSMPIPLRYSGAHTHRLSGDWKLNLQNLPRGGNLRRALIAPPGYEVVTIDSSQIEARIVAWLAGQQDLVDAFAKGDDVYSMFASDVFGYPVNKKDNPTERFVGKQGILGLGYGLGPPKFRDRLKTDSKNQTGTSIEIDDNEAFRIVGTYRRKYAKIPELWRALNNAIPVLAGAGGSFSLGPVTFEPGAVLLPSGLRIHYYDLRQVPTDRGMEWQFTYAGKPQRLYGGKLLENITQALARIVVMDAGLAIQRQFELALQVHDELVYVVKKELVPIIRNVILSEMNRRPTWGPDLPLASEVGVGSSYGEAK